MILLRYLAFGILINFSVSASPPQQWDRYVPEKQRKEFIKKALKTTGLGAVISGKLAGCTWVTEQVARTMVSDAIDKERLTPDEARARYYLLRRDGQYVFLIGSMGIVATPFGAITKEAMVHPSEAFLQRADNRQSFSKGEVNEEETPIYLRGWEHYTFVTIRFSHLNRSNEPIIKDLNDKVEIQFVVSGKKVVLNYKVKEIAARLEDL